MNSFINPIGFWQNFKLFLAVLATVLFFVHYIRPYFEAEEKPRTNAGGDVQEINLQPQ